MTWKDYEILIFDFLKATYKDATITYDQIIKGRYSRVDRQIDVLIESYIAGKKIRLIVDCKYFNKNINVKDVESFISMVEDVDAKQGILITCKGFSPAAINRAYYGPTDVELDILNLTDLKYLQGEEGIIHYGKSGILFPAPFGWIVDATQREGILATFYQRGLTFEKAAKNKEWMYVNIVNKNEENFTLEDLISIQEANIKVDFPKAKFEYDSTIQRWDKSKTLLRTIDIDKYPTNEYTGFIEFDSFIVFFVLFTPIELKSKNIRKLENLLERSLPILVNEESIYESNFHSLQNLINASTDIIEKAELLISQAEILIKLKKYDEADIKYDESASTLNFCYGAIRGKIYIGLLKNENVEELTIRVDNLIDLEPTNPTVCTDLLDLFGEFDRIDDLIYFLTYGAQRYSINNEAVGNFNYHLGLLFVNIGNHKAAEKHLLISKTAFIDSLDKEHYIFSLINQNLKRMKKNK